MERRKTMKKKSIWKPVLLASALAVGLSAAGGIPSAAEGSGPIPPLERSVSMKKASLHALEKDTRVFKTDPSIAVKDVRFENHYGFTVAGHLYLPRDFDPGHTYKAIAVSGPFGAVKEQVSGLYAQELAKRGFVAVAFDPSMTGESSGKRRNMASPDIFTEDYHAAVDFLSSLSFVNPSEIGALGICGLSGMAITAAGSDSRIQAVAVSAMYDMSESISDHYKGAYYTPDERDIVLRHLADRRNEETRTGEFIPGAHEITVDAAGKVQTGRTMFPDKLPAGTDPVTTEFYNYYVGRAYHPRAINSNTSAWDSTMPYGFFDFTLMSNLGELRNKPVLIITGSRAHSKYFSDALYEKLTTPNKEEIVVPGATHTDLYDQLDKIPFDQLAAFFEKNLK